MKGKIFPIIFTTLIATLLFFGAMYRVKNVDNEYGIKKFQECDKKYEFSYTKGSEEIKKTYNYKIQDETALIVILDDGTFHYAVSVMADADQAAKLEATWKHILDSVCAVSTG